MKEFSLAANGALVTGSSQGIGLALARALQRAGARVILHGKEAPASPLPDDCLWLQQDLLEPDAPAQLLAQAFAALPSLDLLVCNAGGFFDVPFLEMERDHWERTINLNVRSTFFAVQTFARELAARGRPGAVVITCSTNGFQSEEDSVAYDTSKGALVMLIRTLAHALAPHRIRVNGIAPGLIRTPLTAGLAARDPRLIGHYEKKILLGRLGEPEDCAGATVFLLSSAAAYITGQVIVIDGGLTVAQIGRL